MSAAHPSTPALSVLLPVRDAAPWLTQALASLARQTEGDFEVIAVDDGSRDASLEILEYAARRDPRIRVFHRPASGLPEALRFACEQARAPLLARQDADDLSHRERFAELRAYLHAHREVDVVSSRVRLFPSTSVGAGMRRWSAWHDSLLTHDAMHAERLIDVPLLNGAAMLRRRAVESAGGWRERGGPEDMDLWLRLFAQGSRFAKLGRRLYSWRQHPGSSTRTDPRYSLERFLALKVEELDRCLLAGDRRATLIGVGESLKRWSEALGESRLRAVIEARDADARVLKGQVAPFVLAFVAPPARTRWRAAAQSADLRESIDFTFVA
jgi:glycosyltransferase involved in cell wall biosynthesis